MGQVWETHCKGLPLTLKYKHLTVTQRSTWVNPQIVTTLTKRLIITLSPAPITHPEASQLHSLAHQPEALTLLRLTR